MTTQIRRRAYLNVSPLHLERLCSYLCTSVCAAEHVCWATLALTIQGKACSVHGNGGVVGWRTLKCHGTQASEKCHGTQASESERNQQHQRQSQSKTTQQRTRYEEQLSKATHRKVQVQVQAAVVPTTVKYETLRREPFKRNTNNGPSGSRTKSATIPPVVQERR